LNSSLHNPKKKRNFSKNVIANLIGRIWSMISVYIFIPLYILFLGQEAYGLVTFFATLQTVMGLLGLGLSKTLRREFAAGVETDENKLRKYKMMRSVELVYLGIALLIIGICYIGAEFIAGSWLNIESLDYEKVVLTLRLMGISIGLQVLTSMYLGCIFGLERQVLANLYQIIWAVAKNLGVILVLWIISGDISLFYIWHVFVDFCYLIALRFTVIRLLKCNLRLEWKFSDFSNLLKLWKYTTGLIFISIVYVLNTQIDKAIISKYLSLKELGAYNIAFSLGNLTSIFATAIATAAFSRFTNYFTTNKLDKQKSSFLFYNKISGLTVITVGAFISVFSYEILLLWTANKEIANLASTPAFYVIVGCLFLSLQIVPYEFMLSRGNTKVNNIIGLCSIPFILIGTPLFVENMGILGAGIAWCINMALSTIGYLGYIHKKFIGSGTLRWLFFDVIIPFIIAFGAAFISKQIAYSLSTNLTILFLFAMFSGGITLIILFVLLDRGFVKITWLYLINYMGRGR
jgi:O-antigen/teichoic acid export membrane protein